MELLFTAFSFISSTDPLFSSLVHLITSLIKVCYLIFFFLSHNISYPLKQTFQYLSPFPDYWIICVVILLSFSFIAAVLQENEEKIRNNWYFIKLYPFYKKFKHKISVFFNYLQFYFVEFLNLGRNEVIKKIIKFTFGAVLILLYLDLIDINLTFFFTCFLIGLVLIINS